jgi:hypothetical protein
LLDHIVLARVGQTRLVTACFEILADCLRTAEDQQTSRYVPDPTGFSIVEPGWPGLPLGHDRRPRRLRRLVGDLPDEQIPSVLADVCRHLAPAAERPWPPSWFSADESKRTVTAVRADDILAEGFDRPA